MIQAVKGWLTNLLEGLDKSLKDSDEALKKMSPEDRERYLQCIAMEQCGRNIIGF